MNWAWTQNRTTSKLNRTYWRRPDRRLVLFFELVIEIVDVKERKVYFRRAPKFFRELPARPNSGNKHTFVLLVVSNQMFNKRSLEPKPQYWDTKPLPSNIQRRALSLSLSVKALWNLSSSRWVPWSFAANGQWSINHSLFHFSTENTHPHK